MVLEGPMIMIAMIALTLFHPGFCLRGKWASISRSREPVTEVYDERKLASDAKTPSKGSLVKVPF